MAAAAQILCTKCGTASAEPRSECANCGGRNARVCAACGFQNSVAKNYCDKCGRSIVELGAIAPPPPTRLPGAAGTDIPATVIRRGPAPGAPPPPGPKAPSGPAAPPSSPAPFAQPGTGGLDDLWAAPAPLAEESPSGPPPASTRARVLNAALMLLAAAAVGAAFLVWRRSQRPEILVPKLTARYLDALKAHDYSAAYGMFSDLAKKNCTEEEFRASRSDADWTWSKLRLAHVEPGAVLMEYDLQVAGQPDRTDHVLFTLENGRWTRPYNWTLMNQVEAAFENGDPDKGLILAQAAATVNPRDPMAWGYLCEAAYYRKAPTVAVPRCEKALSLARTYPSDLTLKSLYHLHAILADMENNALNRPDLALEQFAEMLSFPNISPADQCQIVLARAQSYAKLGRTADALADLDRGASLCANPQDQAYIQTARRTLGAPAQ
jgi:tetratricopeptide (TPR) repeat protein